MPLVALLRFGVSVLELAVTVAGAISTATHPSSRANGARLLFAERPLSCICGSGIFKDGIHFAFQQVCPFSDVLCYGGKVSFDEVPSQD